MLEAVQVLRCPVCEALDPGPRLLCGRCGSSGLLAHPVPGTGTVASWTVIRRPPARFRSEGAYAVVVVDLSVGVRVTGRLNRIPDTLRQGAPVIAVEQAAQVITFEEVAT